VSSWGEDAESNCSTVLLSQECRPLRRSLRPLVWAVLEEVALDAVVGDGQLMARTSARQVADRLGINPSTAANALAALRERGLVTSLREQGPAGRFGLSVYQLGPVVGLSVVRPSMAKPLMATPSVVQPAMAAAGVVSPSVESSSLAQLPSGRPDGQIERAGSSSLSVAFDLDDSGVNDGRGSRSLRGRSANSSDRASSALQCPRQETLDVGSGSS
jgi:hypothetical protein